MFNGKIHDYQGIRGEFYYYMRPCNGWTKNEMPFNMIAKHYEFGRVYSDGNSRTSIEYITMELFDPNTGIIYYLYVNGEFIQYTSTAVFNQASYDYDLALHANKLTELFDGVTQLGVYKITYTSKLSNLKDIVIDIDDSVLGCESTKDISFRIQPSRDIIGDRYRTHRMYVDPPSCSRCYVCCLLGDFTHNDYGWNNPITGEEITIHPGFIYGDTGDADWGCKVNPTDYPPAPIDYTPPSLPEQPQVNYKAYCDPSLSQTNERFVDRICQDIFNEPNNQLCCNDATQDVCNSIRHGCTGDTCAELDYIENPTTIDIENTVRLVIEQVYFYLYITYL